MQQITMAAANTAVRVAMLLGDRSTSIWCSHKPGPGRVASLSLVSDSGSQEYRPSHSFPDVEDPLSLRQSWEDSCTFQNYLSLSRLVCVQPLGGVQLLGAIVLRVFHRAPAKASRQWKCPQVQMRSTPRDPQGVIVGKVRDFQYDVA